MTNGRGLMFPVAQVDSHGQNSDSIFVPLHEVLSREHQGIERDKCRPERALNEELEADLGYYASNPRAEMDHLVNAAIPFATTMHVIQLVVEAAASKARFSILFASRGVFLPKPMDRINMAQDGLSMSA